MARGVRAAVEKAVETPRQMRMVLNNGHFSERNGGRLPSDSVGNGREPATSRVLQGQFRGGKCGRLPSDSVGNEREPATSRVLQRPFPGGKWRERRGSNPRPSA